MRLHQLQSSILHRSASAMLALPGSVWTNLSARTAVKLYERFVQTRDDRDLNMAINLVREVLAKIPTNHPNRIHQLHNLASGLQTRYDSHGTIDDLEEAISVIKKAVAQCPQGHSERGRYLFNYGNGLLNLFLLKGNRDNLTNAITALEESIKCTPINHPDLSERLNALARALRSRYVELGTTDDFDQAVKVMEQAVQTASQNDPRRYSYLCNLGILLSQEFERSGDPDVLDRAITILRDALAVPEVDNVRYTIRLHALGCALMERFEQSGNIDHLTEAIQIHRDAVDSTSDDLPYYVVFLSALGDAQLARFRFTRENDNLDTAIETYEKTLRYTSNTHAKRAEFLKDLAMALEMRHTLTSSTEDVVRAKALFAESVEQTNGNPLIRIQSGISCSLLHLGSSEWVQASRISEASVSILPKLSLRLLSRDDQQRALTHLNGLSSVAASAALHAGEPASKALSLMEICRGIIATLTVNARSDVSDLAKLPPELFEKYTELRDLLYLPDVADKDPEMLRQQSSSGPNRHEILQHLEKLEDKIRAEVPGYKYFQLPPPSEFFTNLASRGPLVTFNVTKTRSDAFVVTEKEIKAIELPKLMADDLQNHVELLTGDRRITRGKVEDIHSRNNGLQKLLEWLWKVAVRPVLKALDMLLHEQPRRLPRIWWVTAGLMGLMPLHAAGHAWRKNFHNTAAYVVSSYVPTFRALAYAREQSSKSSPCHGQRFLLVQMPRTIGYANLDVAEEEHAIRQYIQPKETATLTILDTRSKKDVLEKLKESTAVHFSCHAESFPADPSQSRLILANGENNTPDYLMIRDLASTSLDTPQLSYLSACSTAENASLHLLDEVIHIASSFLLMGFPHVIGTMWEANDDAAIEISKIFYAELASSERQTAEDSQNAFAYALHEATNRLRSGRIEGKRPKKNASSNLIAWAPFIHMGC